MDIKEFIDKGTTIWNSRDRAGFLALCTDQTEFVGPGDVTGKGPEAAGMFWSVWQDAFPDNKVTVHEIAGQGNGGAEEATFSGTHTGPLWSPDGTVPPTGKTVSLRYCLVQTIENDKLTRFHLYFDRVDLLTQLGLMPTPVASAV
jgi:ketosteroid isomerase-like protein